MQSSVFCNSTRLCRVGPIGSSVRVKAALRGCKRQATQTRVHSCRTRSPVVMTMGPGPGMGLSEELKKGVEKFITDNKVVLFMKGTREFPQCGFSNTVVQILNVMGCPYETVNILEDELLRQGMKEFSQWPTFPQVYIDGEFYGGCDIMIEAYQSGELSEVIERSLNS